MFEQFIAGLSALTLGVGSVFGFSAPSATTIQHSTVVVTPSDLDSRDRFTAATDDKWFIYNDENDTIDNSLAEFVNGPDTPPAGQDSVEISVDGSERVNLATYQFRGTALADITTLAYSTYNASAGNGGSVNRSGYLQFNVDFDGSDTWQKRLTFLPKENGDVEQDTWQEWDAINDGNALWRYSGTTWPESSVSGNTAKTWDQIKAEYPGVRIRTSDSWLGIRVGEPYSNGYTENLDAFKFGVNGDITTFDFELVREPATMDECKKGGFANYVDAEGNAFKNQGQCVSYVARDK